MFSDMFLNMRDNFVPQWMYQHALGVAIRLRKCITMFAESVVRLPKR